MSENNQKWFITERTRAFALVHLTRRKDLAITEEDRGVGLQFVAYITKADGERLLRQFGVFLRGALEPTTEQRLNKKLHSTMQSLAEIGQYPYPVCLFYFTMRDDQGYYAWVAEPAVEDDQPRLLVHSEAHCRKLDRQALDEIVAQVDRWDDAFFARIAVNTL